MKLHQERDNFEYGRKELEKVDSGLYSVLYKRKLLDQVFAPTDLEQRKEAVQEVVDALRDFE